MGWPVWTSDNKCYFSDRHLIIKTWTLLWITYSRDRTDTNKTNLCGWMPTQARTSTHHRQRNIVPRYSKVFWTQSCIWLYVRTYLKRYKTIENTHVLHVCWLNTADMRLHWANENFMHRVSCWFLFTSYIKLGSVSYHGWIPPYDEYVIDPQKV